MKIKESSSWKAACNEEKCLYGAEVVFRGSWDLYEISAEVFESLNTHMDSSDAVKMIQSGRHLYSHVNDMCGPPYTIVLDENYPDYCPWMKKEEPVGKTFSAALTDAAVELFDSEKENREQRRNKGKSNPR